MASSSPVPPLSVPPSDHAARRPQPRTDPGRARQVFVNRNLRMDQVALVGFDMDYTLADYHKRHIEELQFEMTLERLVSQLGYPAEVATVRYDPAFVIRGLAIDKERGNIFKVDRHSHVGRCYHGLRRLTREERRGVYRSEAIKLSAPRYAWLDTLFALPEACLFAFIIDRLEGLGRPVDYGRLYDDIRATIDAVHRDGSLKAVLMRDLGRFVVRDPDLAPALHKLRSAGKRLFIATNSYWEYTDAVMSYLLDGMLPEYPQWRRYFDWVVVGTQKPLFFTETRPFLELDESGKPGREAQQLERGRAYQGGNLLDFERFTGTGGDRVLYIGDHIYGDMIKSKRTSQWRTCMVVRELEEEIAHTEQQAAQIRRLHELEALRASLDDDINNLKPALAALERRLERAELAPGERAVAEEERRRDKAEIERLRRAHRTVVHEVDALEGDIETSFNPYWGLVFKEGNENSRFGEQVEDYACVYTSRASNFLFCSPMQYFRAPREIMPHER